MIKDKMRKLIVFGLVAATVISMTACGNKNYTAADLKKMKVEKYVTVPEYKGLKVSVDAKQTVKDKDVSYYIQTKMNENQQFHDKTGTVADGEMVNISYVGTVDGKAFDGGTADSQLLQIGSGSYIEGFESGLVGAKAGSTVNLKLKFPANYSNTTLAGKDSVFNVTINYIVTPLTDQNVAKVDADYKDAASYLVSVKTLLGNYAEYQYKYSVKSAIASQLISGCTYKNIPQSLIDSYKNDLTVSLETTAKKNNEDLNTYVEKTYSVTADKVDSTIASMAQDCAKEGLTLQEIANKEKLNISDEDLNSELGSQASAAGYSSVGDYLGTDGDQEDVRINMMYDKVYDFLIKNAKITNKTS